MTIEDDIAFLERVPILRRLGAPALRMLAIGAESRDLGPGEVLFHAGDPADGGLWCSADRSRSLSIFGVSALPVGP